MIFTSPDIDFTKIVKRVQPRRRKNLRLILVNIICPLVVVLSSVSLIGMTMSGARLFQEEVEGGGTKETASGLSALVGTEEHGMANILVTGIDDNGLTDVTMVVCFDFDKHQASILQIPRDTYVGGVPTGKINTVYNHAKKGELRINALRRRLHSDLGIAVDHYITIDLKGFRKIVDILGGVEVYIEPRKNGKGLTVQNFITNAHYTLGPGNVTLTGMQAESFMRERHSYAMGDLDRAKAQRQFYAGLMKKMQKMSVGKMLELGTKCYSSIGTDMTVDQLLDYAGAARKLDLDKIGIHIVPGQYVKVSGLDCYSIHKQEYVDLFNAHFRPYGNPISAGGLAIKEQHSHTETSYLKDKTFDELK